MRACVCVCVCVCVSVSVSLCVCVCVCSESESSNASLRSFSGGDFQGHRLPKALGKSMKSNTDSINEEQEKRTMAFEFETSIFRATNGKGRSCGKNNVRQAKLLATVRTLWNTTVPNC